MQRQKTEQEIADEAMQVWLPKMQRETKEEKAKAKKLMEGFLVENEKNSLGKKSSEPIGLLETVMQKYGFTEEEALEEIKAFGG